MSHVETKSAPPMPDASIDTQIAYLRRGVEEVLPEAGLREKLEKSRKTGKPLIVKLGCDPSRPDLHLGHAVVLRKLRQFQDLGHQAVLIVGDFTAMIGDPSGRSKTRPALTLEETRENGRSYFEQASKILDPERTRIVYNSEWLGAMTFREVIELSSHYTVARMLERDDFEKRYRGGQPISVHEFLYPLAQAQDSVHIESDIELGGTDQKFNLLVARDVQQACWQEPQVCMTMPLLEGTDGVEKMSKSLDNYIGISEPPEQMYGKTLSIPDHLIHRYYVLTTDVRDDALPARKAFAEAQPRDAKHDLAFAIVRMYHGESAAKSAREHFERTVVRKELPDDMPEHAFHGDDRTSVGLLDLMRESGLVSSNGEARRLVQQGAVSIDGERVDDPTSQIDVASRAPFVIKAGKRRFVRIVA
jgi:tyrosyl-tRNA synthetase